MQDKIIAAIAAYLEDQTAVRYSQPQAFNYLEFKDYVNTITKSHADHCQEIATEIATAIAPLVQAGEVDDTKYTHDFLKWRKKYFKAQTETTYFISKHSSERVSNEDLELRFTRAMRENPIK